MYYSTRSLTRASFIVAVALATSSPAFAVNREWVSGDGIWSNPANWTGGVVPGIGDDAFLGFGDPTPDPVENSVVQIDQPVFVKDLWIDDGMWVANRVNDGGAVFPVTVDSQLTLQEENEPTEGMLLRSTLLLHRSPAAYDLDAPFVSIYSGSQLALRDGAIANISGHMSTWTNMPDSTPGQIAGHGVYNLSGANVTLSNNGIIDPRGELIINQTGGGQFELDGPGEAGLLWLAGASHPDALGNYDFDHLTLNGTTLFDTFSGGIQIANDRKLTMNLTSGWTADAASQIVVMASTETDNSAVFEGNHVTLEGSMQLQGGGSKATFDSDATINGSATFQLANDALLRFAGATTVNGGQFVLADGARFLQFNGPTTMRGGEFNTHSDSLAEGSVLFNDATVWEGDVTINGVARQTKDAVVSGITTINADRFDMDGAPEWFGVQANWEVNSLLTVNANQIDVGNDQNHFAGVMTIGGGATARTMINLADPDASWMMSGTLNLENNLPFGATRFAGTKIWMIGVTNVSGTDIRIDADAAFGAESTTTFDDANSSLTMRQHSRVYSGAQFVGDGLLQNAATGHMILDDGASTDDVGLRNSGLLDIDEAAGIASVDSFENAASGTLLVDVGGYLPGNEHDLLQVTDGETMLAGSIEVSLIDAGSGLFLPEVGDEFTVLTSVGEVLGSFSNDPVSVAPGKEFQWEVLYHPHDVTLRLVAIDNVVPEPTALLLAGMSLVCINIRRWRGPSAKAFVVLILALVVQPHSAQAIDRSWNADSGFWSTASDWSPNGVPQLGDVVRLGDLPAIENVDVVLDQNDAVAQLHITDGMTFNNQDHTFSVLGITSISGLNVVNDGMSTTFNHSRIFIRPTPAPVQFSTNSLVVTDEGRVRLDGGVVEVRGSLSTDSDSSIFGHGQINFIGPGVVLANSGVIDPSDPMAFHVLGGGEIDLDGTGTGQIQLNRRGDRLTINGGTLSDSFGGEIVIDDDASLHMNLDSPWEADPNSRLQLGRPENGIHPDPSIISGTEVTLSGDVEVTAGTHGRFDADVIYGQFADVAVAGGGELEMNGAALLVGGTFTLDEDANANFDGPATVEGGAFNTFSKLSTDGRVRFNNDTTYNGELVINGIAQQFGDATVSGQTSIQAGVFDMDGGGNTAWKINHFLTIDAESIDSTISNTFDGTIDFTGLFGRLTVNLTGAFDEWTMNGELRLDNNLPGAATRLSGSPVRMTGELSADGGVRITSDLTFAGGSETSFASAASEIRLTSNTQVEAGAVFLDSGTLHNQTTGNLTLEAGATLNNVGLVNAGLLEVGDSPGTASVDRFENTADGTWLVEIGGYLAGNEHDLLLVTGGDALLDGSINVDLIDIGSGVFLPEVGDEFRVLTAGSGVMGTFLADPVSLAAGQEFQWEVLYNPLDVTLRLAEINSIVPEPSTFGLLGLAALGCLGVRHRRPRGAALCCLIIALSTAVPTRAEFNYRTVALTGLPAPETALGVNYDTFSNPRISNSGRVVFRASIFGPGVVPSQNDVGIFTINGEEESLVARSDEMPPGLVGNLEFNGSWLGVDGLFSTADGAVFHSRITGTGIGDDNNDGLFTKAGAGLDLLAVEGGAAPAAGAGVVLHEPRVMAVNPAGNSVIRTKLLGTGVTTTNEMAIYTMNSGEAQLIARKGDLVPTAAPGTTYSNLTDRIRINNAGTVAFTAALSSGAGVFTNTPGGVQHVALTGMAVPDSPAGTNFENFQEFSINESDEIVFVGDIISAGGEQAQGLYSTVAGLHPIVELGDAAPGTILDPVFDSFGTPLINNLGDAVARVKLSGPGVFDTNDDAIYKFAGGGIELVARQNSLIPGATDLARFGDAFSLFYNDLDQVAFTTDLQGTNVDATNDHALFAETGGELQLIAREGDLFDVDPDPLMDDLRQIAQVLLSGSAGPYDGRASLLNASGQLVFGLSFTDGSQGIFIAETGATGDYDLDGDVDGYDFLAWQRGDSFNPLSPADLAAWQESYGNSDSALATARALAVPEPATLVLLVGAFAFLTSHWHFHRSLGAIAATMTEQDHNQLSETSVVRNLPNIKLVTLDPAIEQSLSNNPAYMDAMVKENWDQVARIVYELAGRKLTASPSIVDQLQWGGYFVVDAESDDLVGSCAFKSEPTENGVVEIAYFTYPGFESQGYATAMAQKLIKLANVSAMVKQVVAHTLPENSASTRVLEKAGMNYVGEVVEPDDGRVWLWKISVGNRM